MTTLAIHPGALGDLVLFGQFLAAVRASRGGDVRLVARRAVGRLLAGLGVVDEALDFDALPMDEVYAVRPPDECVLPDRLRSCRLLVSCFAGGDAQAERRLVRLASAAESVFLPVRPPADWRGHVLELWAKRSGLGVPPVPRWSVPATWRRRAAEALAAVGADPGRDYVLAHPGSGGREKCWPLERFAELARRSRRAVVFVVGPVEQDWWSAEALAEIGREFPLIVSPPLEVLAALAGGAAAWVGNDSGPTHLAAAVGAPVVAVVVGPAVRHFAPRGKQVRVVSVARAERCRLESVQAALRISLTRQ